MHYLSPFLPDWKETLIAQMEAFAAEQQAVLNECTRAARFPREVYRELGRRGWLGPMTPTEMGGLGGGVPEYGLIEEEVGRLGIVSPQISVQGQLWLTQWGTEEQQARYLGGLARGELIFCEAISEPGVGSSLKLMQTSATRDGADWIVKGRKTHVNLGAEADLMLVYAVADAGLTSFLVDAHSAGITARQTKPIGLRLIPTAEIELDGVRVPDSARLGGVGEGLQTFLSAFNISRLGNASELIGFGRRALAEAVAYAKTRPVDEHHHVTDFQGIQWTLADGFTKLYAASLARDRAALLAQAGAPHALETSLAKKLAIEAAEYAVNEAFALVGGHGLYEETPFLQLMAEVKTLRVAGGSLEILRNHIARCVLKSERSEGLA